MYILSCEKAENGGGIYRCEIHGGELKINAYLPCDRPMYAVRAGGRLHVLLRAPFVNNENSGYFSCSEDLSDKTKILDTLGKVACHLCVIEDDVYITNYISGNIVKNCQKAVAHTGRGANIRRQEAPHTHCVISSSCGKYILCTDLGTDTLYIYDRELNRKGTASVPAGYGIRHIVFSKDGKYIYAINELAPSVSIFEWQNAMANYLNTVKLTETEGATGAAIRISKDGNFLYCSVRGENALYVLRAGGAKLTAEQKTGCGGDSPRDFNITDDEFLVSCNENSDSVVWFPLQRGKIGKKAGELKLKKPLCCEAEKLTGKGLNGRQ